MRKKRPVSLDKLVAQNPDKTKQQILAEEGLGSPDLTIDTSCHKKTYGEKAMLKKMKAYHKQFGNKLNTQGAKHAFFHNAMKSHGRNKNLQITTV